MRCPLCLNDPCICFTDEPEPPADAEYYVIARKRCPECNGDGYVEHPDWRALVKYEAETGRIVDDLDAWFRERGYDYPPDQEVVCDECGGTGWIETRARLEEAIEIILAKRS